MDEAPPAAEDSKAELAPDSTTTSLEVSAILGRLSASYNSSCGKDGVSILAFQATVGSSRIAVPMEFSKGGINDKLSLSCPALSLEHDSRLSLQAGSTKKQAEDHAAALLARRLRVVKGQQKFSTAGENSNDDDDTQEVSSLAEVPELLLRNLVGSLSVLIHCRLRNYAIFLARHGISLAEKCTEAEGVLGIEQKINSLLETGQRISVSTMTFDFLKPPSESKAEASSNNIQIRSTIKLELQLPSKKRTKIVVNVSAPGKFLANRGKDGKLEGIDVSIDTRSLLNVMIEQASAVVAKVVEAANTAKLMPEASLPRTASFLSMPPPPNRERHPKTDLAAASEDDETPVVTPDFSSALRAPPKGLPSLDLVADNDVDRILLGLSPDECECIVDHVFGDMDQDLLTSGPQQAKKLKTE